MRAMDTGAPGAGAGVGLGPGSGAGAGAGDATGGGCGDSVVGVVGEFPLQAAMKATAKQAIGVRIHTTVSTVDAVSPMV
jgi:hypothetical protein